MKRFLYLFLILFSFQLLLSQDKPSATTPQTTAIEKQLNKIAKDPDNNLKQKEAQLLQLKKESESLGYDLGIFFSGDMLMRLYNIQQKHKEVIELGDQLKKIAEGKKDTYGYISSIYRKNALVLGYLGLDDASIKDFRTAIKFAQTIENKDAKSYQLSLCYENMTVYYDNKHLDKKSEDSRVYYLKKSLDEAKKISDNSKKIPNDLKYGQIAYDNMAIGVAYLSREDTKENIKQAEKYLLEGLRIHENKEYNIPTTDKITMLNQVSWLYSEKQEFQKSIDYALRALEMEKQFRDPHSRMESFEFLADSYTGIGEKEKSKLYLDKYSFLKDSLNVETKNLANATMKKMVAEAKQEETSNTRKILIIIGIAALLAGVITVILWRRKNKTLRKNYEQIIEKLKNEALPHEPEITIETNDLADEQQLSENKNVISSHTEARILKGLETFEKSEKFLKADFTMGNLVAQLNTNTKYLSDIIKNHKSQNFNSYLNSLRINYINNKLYNEPKYREYKITYLAQQCGYSSPQVFAMAFKKVNGVNPSYFIQNLKDDNL